MFTSFKNKPDAQKIISDDSATCGKDVAERILNSIQIVFPMQQFWKINAQQLEAADFYNCT